MVNTELWVGTFWENEGFLGLLDTLSVPACFDEKGSLW